MAADSRTLLPALPHTEVATAAVMTTCEDLAVMDGMDHFDGAVRGLGMRMSNGGAAPGGALGVGGFEFDDASPQFPAASDIFRGESLYGLPSAGRGNITIGSGGRGSRWSPFGCGGLLGH
jgi:hypothetical protein